MLNSWRHLVTTVAKRMQSCYRFGDVEVRCAERRILVSGQPVPVGARAFDLLVALIEHRSRVVGKDELLAIVWSGLVVEEANIEVQISALRKIIGPQALTTVAGRGYRFSAVLDPDEGSKAASVDAADAGLAGPPLPDKPSIAVLPFANLSAEPEHRFFADGVTQDVITALSRFHSLFVIAHNSTLTYAGTGALVSAGKRVRVAAQLIDAVTRRHLWGEHYDRMLEDIFDVQEEVTRSIVGAVAPEVAAAEIATARRRRPASLSAYEIAVRAWSDAWSCYRRADSPGLDLVLLQLERALAIDADSTLALNAVAFIQWQRVFFRAAPLLSEARETGLKAARRAIELDPTDSLGYVQKGSLLAHAIDDSFAIPHEDALDSLRTAQELNPNDHYAIRLLGLTEATAGYPTEGIKHVKQALRLNPRDPFSANVKQMLSVAHFAEKTYAEGVRWGLSAVEAAPTMANALLSLARNLVGTGDIERARSAWTEARRLATRFGDACSSGLSPFRLPEDRLRNTVFLRVAAGLEDSAAAAAYR